MYVSILSIKLNLFTKKESEQQTDWPKWKLHKLQKKKNKVFEFCTIL